VHTGRILRIGHRGAAGHMPENTLASLDAGISLGADYIEVDVQSTRDGRLVLMHDKFVDRTTNGTGKLVDLEWAEIRKLDAGHGERVPLLDEVLETANGRAGLILECITPGLGLLLYDAVRRFGFRDPVIFSSFLHAEIRDIRDRDSQAQTMALLEGIPVTMTAFALECGAIHAGLALDSLTVPFVNALRRAGVCIFLYTADTPAQIAWATEFAPDGIISNYPERI
jgi:glycerophosphoryl diester phosphodiesterase